MSLTNIRKIPHVREFLLDISIYDVLERIVEKHQLPSQRLEELLDLTDAVINGKLEVAKMPEFIQKAFGIDQEQSKAVASDVAGHRLLPLANFLPEVEQEMISWGAQVGSYPKVRIPAPGIEDDLIAFAQEIGLELPEPVMKRFAYLSGGYLKGERDAQATKNLMMRPLAVGGLGLSEAQVSQLFDTLNTKFKKDDFAKEQKISERRQEPEPEPKPEPTPEPEPKPEPKPEPTPEPEPKPEPLPEPEPQQVEPPNQIAKNTLTRDLLPIKAVPHALSTDVPIVAGHLFDDEEQEVAQIKQKLEKKGVGKNESFESRIAEQKTLLTAQIWPECKSAGMTRVQVDALIDALLRGRLDEQRAFITLTQKHALAEQKAYEVLKPIMESYKTIHAVERPATQSIDRGARVQKERQLLNERHATLTSSSPRESIDPVLLGARVSASRSYEQEKALQAKKIDPEKVKQAQIQARPPKAKVRLSATSAPPKSAQERSRKVADIKRTPKIIGPTEELLTMGIAEFRRLSSDPSQASDKILHTLSLLEDQDYEDRMKGIVAWRKSPLYTQYVELMRMALEQGKPVGEVASTKRNAGEETLNAAEIDALITLNEQIKF